MVLSMIEIDGMASHTEMPYPYQTISVKIDDRHRVVNAESIKGNVDMYAMINVTRMFFSGDVSKYEDMMYAENRTVSAQCTVAILPKREL